MVGAQANPNRFHGEWYFWRDGMMIGDTFNKLWLLIPRLCAALTPGTRASNYTASFAARMRQCVAAFGVDAAHIRTNVASLTQSRKRKLDDSWNYCTPAPTQDEKDYTATFFATIIFLCSLATKHCRWTPPNPIDFFINAKTLLRVMLEWLLLSQFICITIEGLGTAVIEQGNVDLIEFVESQRRAQVKPCSILFRDDARATLHICDFLQELTHMALNKNRTVVSTNALQALHCCVTQLSVLIDASVLWDPRWRYGDFLKLGLTSSGRGSRVGGA